MTLTGSELNRRFSSDGFDPKDYDIFQDLLNELGIENPRAHYIFMGYRFPNDPKPINLVPQSSMKEIHKIVVVSAHMGG